MASIGVGATAPDFTKTTQDGDPITLSQFRGDKTVVLYFYPKDETPGCTAEACTFRDTFEDFVEAGAVVIGVSQDSDDLGEGFRAQETGTQQYYISRVEASHHDPGTAFISVGLVSPRSISRETCSRTPP